MFGKMLVGVSRANMEHTGDEEEEEQEEEEEEEQEEEEEGEQNQEGNDEALPPMDGLEDQDNVQGGIQTMKFNTEVEAWKCARFHYSRFGAMGGWANHYLCNQEGCNTQRVVRREKKPTNGVRCWTVRIEGECVHPPVSGGKKWHALGPRAHATLVTLLQGYNSPYQALSLLRKQYKADPIEGPLVMDSRVTRDWVANFSYRVVKPLSPKRTVEGWIGNRAKEPPDNAREPFILDSECELDGTNFWVALSTRVLLQNAARGLGCKLVSMDGTFRIIKELHAHCLSHGGQSTQPSAHRSRCWDS